MVSSDCGLIPPLHSLSLALLRSGGTVLLPGTITISDRLQSVGQLELDAPPPNRAKDTLARPALVGSPFLVPFLQAISSALRVISVVKSACMRRAHRLPHRNFLPSFLPVDSPLFLCWRLFFRTFVKSVCLAAMASPHPPLDSEGLTAYFIP